jgi:hypothetical protein
MGRLQDVPALQTTRGGEGRKFVRIYTYTFDDDDRAVFRGWVETLGTTEAHRRLVRDFPEISIGRSSVERGSAMLRAVGWDASKINP